MKKHNVISWSLIIALAAMLEQTIRKQPVVEPINTTAFRVSHMPASNEDKGTIVFTDKRKTTADDSDYSISEQQLEQINDVLIRYE